MVERQTPNLMVGGSSPSWPAKIINAWSVRFKNMKNLSTFFWEVKYELSKVIWPSRSEFLGAVVVVLITIVAFAIFLGFVNYVFYMASLKGFQSLVFGR